MPTLIKPRTTAAALAAARDAAERAATLETKAAEAHAEAARIDADAVDLLVDDPAQAERIGREVDAQNRLANAYTTKAGAERAEADKIIREALLIESERLDKHADTLDKKAKAHQAKVDELLTQLEDLDGVSYRVAPLERFPGETMRPAGEPETFANTRAEDMENDVIRTRFQASVIRYVLEHGATPERANALDYRDPNTSPFLVTLNNEYISQHRDYFIAPLLAAYLAGTILDYTPED
ncbi:hypothetical protein [Micrococcus luteus]|uniref:hypothetical protein n=1 Tax=Micrococcus luteus TaxID=1270 RepID=UPI0015D82AA8|nr:hypothetical protein [Micrococcus luteus]